MIKLILFILAMAVLILGDVIWDYVEEFLWRMKQSWPGLKLSFDKRRRPARHHYKYY